jgi:hypothetical protein
MKLSHDQRNALVHQVARRLEKLDDTQLADLESTTRPTPAVSAAAGLPRRSFLRSVLLYAGAGLTVGGAAAYARERWDAGQAVAPVAEQAAGAAVEGFQLRVDDSAAELALVRDSLTAAQAALEELRPQLSAALAENASLKNSLAEAQNNLLAKQQEADGLLGQLGESQARIGSYQQLVGLFEQLDTESLDTAVVNGLAAAAVNFSGILGSVPIVLQGIAAGRGLLEAFERQFPAIRASLEWLRGRLEGLSAGMAVVENATEQAVDRLDPAANRVAQLVDYILSHLPFGIGRNIRQALVALNDLYHSLPDLITGANTQVVGVLSEQFGEGKAGLGKAVFQPVRDGAFAPAEQLAGQVNTLHDSYVRDLHDPLVGVIDRRAAVRKQIADFRAAQGL